MDDSSMALDEAIKAARKGDLAAFERVVSAFERRIFGYLYRIVGTREDAEDLTQEVFIKVYKKLDTFKEGQSFKTWIFTIATNTAYDYLRKKRVRPEFLLVDNPDYEFETEDPVDTYKSIEAGHDVEQALSKLKPAYRTVLLLFYKYQLTCEEIAQTMHSPVGTVKTHLSRARAALKKLL